MTHHLFRLIAVFIGFMSATLFLQAQEEGAEPQTDPQDSLIQQLRHQIQEMNMQQVLLQEELRRVGQNARMDSISQARRRRRIDSLRQILPGAPLVIDGDTLLRIYALKGGMQPEARVKEAQEAILDAGHRLTFKSDSVYVYEGDFSSDIMVGEQVVLSITDIDGLYESKPRAELAKDYAVLIQQKIAEIQDDYGLRQKLTGLLLAVLVLVVQFVAIKLTNRLFAKWKFRLSRRIIGLIQPIKLKDYEFLSIHQLSIIVVWCYNALRYAFIIFQLCVSITLLFIIFPETETLVWTVFGYIWNPFKSILLSFFGYLPKLFQIAVIWACFHYLIKGVKYFANEIETGHLKLSGFYPDWAQPTYYILRVLLYSLMLVMIWPLLPNSNSEIFQGVSVFIGIIVSLGSTSIIGNIMAGMVMTYMRPFRIGDYIKVGDTVGEVIEKTVLVTRIRTRKNEVVTIQNSSLMGSQTSNYTVAAQNYNLVVHTKVTIGYDVPWQQVKRIMERAAAETPGVLSQPKPFMMTTALNDFYVEYEINAFTDDAVRLPAIYSALHQNLLKSFFDEGVEIMSPHIIARRDGIDLQMPADYQPKA